MVRTGAWLCAIAVMATPFVCMGGFDAPFPDGERAKLEQFASRELARADKSYAAGNFRQAAVEYEAFIRQFQKSPAAPYALFQKARCAQFGEEPDKAIQTYGELLDYYPNLVQYAAPALYFTAETHLQIRDLPKAMKTWMELASDPDYRQHPITAAAINQLAPNLMQQGKTEEALKLYRQCAVDFRSSNQQQALQAMNAVIEHYTINAPNEPELRKFYREAGGFDRAARAMDANADVAQDRLYWQGIWERVWAKAKTYTVLQGELKRQLTAYWAEAFKGRFPDWKEYQDQLAAFSREAASVP